MKTLEQKFFSKVQVTDGCWLWTGAVSGRGYGQFGVNRRLVGAHRLSYEMHFGVIPAGQLVCHKCDTPRCVRPDHLFLGTYQDNADDKVRKGRHPVGSRSSSSKISDDDVVQMRSLHATGEYSYKTLSKKFGVTKGNVAFIILRKSWNHI